MGIDLEKLMNDNVIKAIASQAIANLTPENRDAILAKAVEKSFTSYDFKNGVEKAVADKAIAIASEMLDTSEWNERIRKCVTLGIEIFEKQVAKAVFESLSDAMFGTDSNDTYNRRPSPIRSKMKWSEEKEQS